MLQEKKILVCAAVPSETEPADGAARVPDLVRLCRASGWAVTFVGHDGGQPPEAKEKLAAAVRGMGAAVYFGIHPQVERLAAAEQFDVAVVAAWDLAETVMPMVRRASPRTRVLVESADLQFVRKCRGTFAAPPGAGAGAGPAKLDAGYAAEMVRELNAYASADAVLTVSRREADLVNDLVGGSGRAYVLPDVQDATESAVAYDRRRGMVLAGNFRHAASLKAVEYLCHEVLPRVDSMLLIRHPVFVVGDGAGEDLLRAICGSPHLRLAGSAQEAGKYLHEARAAIAPAPPGAGSAQTRRAVLAALLAGTPVVATAAGAQGLNLRSGLDVLVADGPAEFAEGLGLVLTDKGLWKQLAREGRQRVLPVHGPEAVRVKLEEILAEVMGRAGR